MKPEELKTLLRNTMRDNPKSSQKEIHDLCLRACSADNRLQIALFEYWFKNSYRDLTIVEFEESSTAILTTEHRRNTEDRPARLAAVNDLKERLKACLMDHELSDGTQLRDATFSQCSREGGWLMAIAKCGNANEIVGKKLTESDLRTLQKRFIGKRVA